MGIDAKSAALNELVDPHAEVELVATGFQFTEGPVWNDRDAYLLFSDVSGDVTVRWSEGDGATDWHRPSGHANGLVYDADNRLFACEHDRSVVTRTEADGTVAVVASHYDGKELNSPNDVCVASDGEARAASGRSARTASTSAQSRRRRRRRICASEALTGGRSTSRRRAPSTGFR